jgi:hypothetical protein
MQVQCVNHVGDGFASHGSVKAESGSGSSYRATVEERSYRVIKSHSIDEEHEERCDSEMNLSIVWNFIFEVPYRESNVIEAWVSSECPCLLWTPYAAIKHRKT